MPPRTGGFIVSRPRHAFPCSALNALRSHAGSFRLRNPREHLYREINHRLTWPRYFNTPTTLGK